MNNSNVVFSMKYFKSFAFILFLLPLLGACEKQEIPPFDEPFVHIMHSGLSSVEVGDNRRDVVSYYIYYSTSNNSRDLEVEYKITVGDGLQEGRDFELITTEDPLVFPSGITRRPLQIRWLDHQVDPSKDNTIRIRITGTSGDVSVGLPGPDQNQKELLITKVSS